MYPSKHTNLIKLSKKVCCLLIKNIGYCSTDTLSTLKDMVVTLNYFDYLIILSCKRIYKYNIYIYLCKIKIREKRLKKYNKVTEEKQ